MEMEMKYWIGNVNGMGMGTIAREWEENFYSCTPTSDIEQE